VLGGAAAQLRPNPRRRCPSPVWRWPSFDPTPGDGALLRCGRARQRQQRRLAGCCPSGYCVADEVTSHLLHVSWPSFTECFGGGSPRFLVQLPIFCEIFPTFLVQVMQICFQKATSFQSLTMFPKCRIGEYPGLYKPF